MSFSCPRRNNWWGPAGQTGPCGPDTEIFLDTGKPKCGEDCTPACDCGKYLEIWNNVFMQYYKDAEGKLSPMEHRNVDTGMGLERTLVTLNGYASVYETDVFDFCDKEARGALRQKARRRGREHRRDAHHRRSHEDGDLPHRRRQARLPPPMWIRATCCAVSSAAPCATAACWAWSSKPSESSR